MARHWSRFVIAVTGKQASALDKMAEEHGLGDGMDLLTRESGYSRSKIGRMDMLSLRPIIDRCFKQYGRDRTA